MKKLAFFLSFGVLGLLFLYRVRFSLGEIRTNVLDGFLLVAIVVLIFTLWKEKNRIQLPKMLLFGSGMIFVGVFFSALQDGLSFRELGILKSWFVLPFVFGVFLVNIFRKKREQKYLLWGYVLGTFVVSVVSFLLFFEGSGVTYDKRLSGWYASPNELAMYTVPAILFLWIDIRRRNALERHKIRGIFSYIAFVVLGVVLLLTQSYGGILSLSGGIIVFEFLSFGGIRKETVKKWRKKAFSLFLFLGMLFFGCFLFFGEYIGYDSISPNERSSLASRMMIWQSAWDIGKDHFFVGIGPGNFQEYYLEYQQYYPPYLEWAVPQPHNIFLAFWLQGGILGLFGFFVIVGVSVCYLWKEIQKQKKSDAHTLFLLSFFIMTIVWGLVDTPYWRNDLSVLFWMCIFMSTLRATSTEVKVS